MDKIKIKVRSASNSNTFEYKDTLDPNFVASRENPEFLELIQKACDASHFEEIVEVYATVYYRDL